MRSFTKPTPFQRCGLFFLPRPAPLPCNPCCTTVCALVSYLCTLSVPDSSLGARCARPGCPRFAAGRRAASHRATSPALATPRPALRNRPGGPPRPLKSGFAVRGGLDHRQRLTANLNADTRYSVRRAALSRATQATTSQTRRAYVALARCRTLLTLDAQILWTCNTNTTSVRAFDFV